MRDATKPNSFMFVSLLFTLQCCLTDELSSVECGTARVFRVSDEKFMFINTGLIFIRIVLIVPIRTTNQKSAA